MNKLTLILTATAVYCSVSVLAQNYEYNPFEPLGKKAEVLTLSQGKYKEVYDNDTIMRIGSVLFDRVNNKVVAFLNIDTLYDEATLDPEIVSRFLSPDPIAREFPELTPYQFASNNPIWNIDLEGLEGVPFLLRPFSLSPGGLIMQKATANTIFVAANRNLTDVNAKFSSEQIKSLQANSTNSILYQQFTNKISGLSPNQVRHNFDIEKTGKLQSDLSAEGPFAPDQGRFVEDPGNPGIIIDMRHFLVIGSSFTSKELSEGFGLAVEIVQDVANKKSAYDIQDYYSNQLGAEFFSNYYDAESNKSFSEQLSSFFKEREQKYQKTQQQENEEK